MTEADGADLIDLFDGWVAALTGAGVGVYRETGGYPDDEETFAIVLGALPQSPSRVIALTPYTISDSYRVDDSVVAMNVRIRGDEDLRTALRVEGQIFGLMHGMPDAEWGELLITASWRQNSNPAGQDDNYRQEWQSSYYHRVNWATANRDA